MFLIDYWYCRFIYYKKNFIITNYYLCLFILFINVGSYVHWIGLEPKPPINIERKLQGIQKSIQSPFSDQGNINH